MTPFSADWRALAYEVAPGVRRTLIDARVEEVAMARFTEHFRLTPTHDDDWFDALLREDTRLFVDPFLVADDNGTTGVWAGAHDEVVRFFNHVLTLLLKAGKDTTSQHHGKATRLLDFPEPEEFCLGYAVGSTAGAGSGAGIAKEMAAAAEDAIEAGLQRVEAFEELVLIKGGVGADRISDIVCNILKHRFVTYTSQVAAAHGVPVQPLPVRHAAWDEKRLRWRDGVLELPMNPFNGKGVLLSPRRFLRDLPTVDPEEFWVYAHDENEALRGDLNYELGAKVDPDEIARVARRHPDSVKGYIESLRHSSVDPYDVENDPRYELHWWEDGRHIADRIGALSADPDDDFVGWVRELVEVFRHSVEKQGDWDILWNGNRDVSEMKCQRLFSSIVRHYCKAHDIDLSPESNAGRGPVDFKFSAGWTRRALVEMKKANNSKLVSGIAKQLPAYQDAEEVQAGVLLIMRFHDNDKSDDKVERIEEAREMLADTAGLDVSVVWVDARQKDSASKL
ncbi:hypothetical protein [Egicoccus sp. AB-alg2]|uniref:hypothetical protein n=1 Tax=Egicoccus sp. AB-alg2 TaxID=3242693 RepID=UPI00359CCCCE